MSRNSTSSWRIALDDGRRCLGYDELDETVAAESRWLAAAGERFGLLAGNGTGWAVTDLALHHGRLPCVPLPDYFTDAQVSHALDDSGIDCMLTDDPGRASRTLPGWRTGGISDRSGLILLRRTLRDGQRAALPAGTVKVTYTSGSTGAPKGVCLGTEEIDSVAQSLADATSGLGIERHLCLLPFATLLENIAGIHAPIVAGVTCVMPPASVTGMNYAGPDGARLLACIAEVQPHSLILVPELLRLLVTAAERGWRVPRTLKFIAVGGAPIARDLLSRADGVGLPVFEGYGLSECASVVCLNVPGAHRPGSVGRPLPHARVRLDAAGQIVVSGVTLRGYLGDAPRQPGAEWATGDLGDIDADGYLRIRGRQRNVYITSLGRNVAPEWVECEIARDPSMRHVLVHGESRPYSVALVSAVPGAVDDAAIERGIADANARLPDYARVRRWARSPELFCFENGLLTSNGRLRRGEILRRHGALLEALYLHESPSNRDTR